MPVRLVIRGGSSCVSRKYQFMEQNNQRRVAGLQDKMPDIQKTLETVRFLKTRKVGVMCSARNHTMLIVCCSLVRTP